MQILFLCLAVVLSPLLLLCDTAFVSFHKSHFGHAPQVLHSRVAVVPHETIHAHSVRHRAMLDSPITFATATAALGCFLGACRHVHGHRSHHVARRADPLMPWRIPNTQQYQWLSVRELLIRERILMVTDYIDEAYANAMLAILLYLQSEDAAKPIQIYLSVPGAQLKPALALYDTIEQLKAKGCKVTTVAYSLCYGMGAVLAGAGTEGRRFATPNTMFLLAKTGLESPFQGQAEDIEIEVKQMLRESLAVEEILSKNTKQPVEKIQEDLKRNFYMSAAQAAEYGLIDRVLVPDYDKGASLTKGVRDPWSGQVVKEKVGFGVFADPNQPRTAV